MPAAMSLESGGNKVLVWRVYYVVMSNAATIVLLPRTTYVWDSPISVSVLLSHLPALPLLPCNSKGSTALMVVRVRARSWRGSGCLPSSVLDADVRHEPRPVPLMNDVSRWVYETRARSTQSPPPRECCVCAPLASLARLMRMCVSPDSAPEGGLRLVDDVGGRTSRPLCGTCMWCVRHWSFSLHVGRTPPRPGCAASGYAQYPLLPNPGKKHTSISPCLTRNCNFSASNAIVPTAQLAEEQPAHDVDPRSFRPPAPRRGRLHGMSWPGYARAGSAAAVERIRSGWVGVRGDALVGASS
ncbi:hypothetical protein DFH06DRAFT_1305107 [Mycena polygramma]|nr:hypothetical protein DFH06DRAFT_1305107 [Mycena polygramma]